MTINRRRLMFLGNDAEIGMMGTVTIAESTNNITLGNDLGSTELMCLIFKTNGIDESVWSLNGAMYIPYGGNNRVGGVDYPYWNPCLESRDGWEYSSGQTRQAYVDITESSIVFHNPPGASQAVFTPGTYKYIVVKL